MDNMESKSLNLNDLDGISGGNYNETVEIMNAINANPTLAGMFRTACGKVSGLDEDVDIIAATNVLSSIGINANLDYSTPNHNKYNNGSLSHAEVLKRIKGYKK